MKTTFKTIILLTAFLISSLGSMHAMEKCSQEDRETFSSFVKEQKKNMESNADVFFIMYLQSLKACSEYEKGSEAQQRMRLNMQLALCLSIGYAEAEKYLAGLIRDNSKRSELCSEAVDFCNNSYDDIYTLETIKFKAEPVDYPDLGNMICEKEVAFTIKRANCIEFLF